MRWPPKPCDSCGYIVKKISLSIRDWRCPNCDVHHYKDVNASKNILVAPFCGAIRFRASLLSVC
ncbi:transposase [Synechocystis salina LEGE 06155]|nr:transposase [Synechocystis salina LEGE 06155]